MGRAQRSSSNIYFVVQPFSHSSHSSWLSPVDTSLYFSPLVGRGPVEQLMDPFVISCVGWMQGASRSVVTITHYEARKGVTVGGPHPCQVYRRMSGEVRLPPQSSFVTTPLVTPRSAQCAPRWPSVTRLHRHTHQQLVIACMWQCNVTWPLELQTFAKIEVLKLRKRLKLALSNLRHYAKWVLTHGKYMLIAIVKLQSSQWFLTLSQPRAGCVAEAVWARQAWYWINIIYSLVRFILVKCFLCLFQSL